MLTAEPKLFEPRGTWQGRLQCTEGAIAKSALSIAAGALVCMTALNVVNVVCRYVFSASLSWSDEAMSFLMAISVFLGAIAATREGLHIRIDIFVSRLSARRERIVSVLALGLTIVVLCVLSHASYRVVAMLASFDQRSDALELPIWTIQAMVPLSLLTSAVPLASRLATVLADRAHAGAQEDRS